MGIDQEACRGMKNCKIILSIFSILVIMAMACVNSAKTATVAAPTLAAGPTRCHCSRI